MLKTTLQKTFLKAQNTYASSAIIQEKMQDVLLKILTQHLNSRIPQKSYFQNILELGCGSGGFSKKISQTLNFEHFLAMDIVDFSKEFMGEKIEFLQGDMEDIKSLKAYLPFDLIASNAALQWSNQKKILQNIHNLANQNAYLLLGIFGKNNLLEMREFLGIGLEYLSLEEYTKILSPKWEILELFSTQESLSFNTSLEVFRHLKNTGVNVYGSTHKLTKSHLFSYAKNFQNKLTYEPLYLLAQKK